MGEISAMLRVPASLMFKHSDICYALPLVGTPLYEYGKELGLIGQTVEDEEEFLETVSDVSYHKRYFINFNGAPMSEVVFWDMLVFLEATRTYNKLMKGKTEDQEMIKKFTPRKAILTNLHTDIDYNELKKKLSKNIVPAYDGLSVIL